MADSIIIDASALFAKIRAIQRDARPEPYMRAIGLRLMGWVDANFKAEGIEVKWPKLSPNTIAGRRKASAAVLQDTGRLRMSWTRAAGNPHIIGDLVRITSNVRYAEYHEFGTGPYVIKPKKPGGRLAFKAVGGMRFATKVNHPGLPKRQMTPSEQTARRLATQTLNAAIERMLAKARAT